MVGTKSFLHRPTKPDTQIMEKIINTEQFADLDCEKCGKRIDTEEALMELGGEPFNGTSFECTNDGCDAEYSINMLIEIEKLD